MNILPLPKRATVIRALCDGNSIRGTSRIVRRWVMRLEDLRKDLPGWRWRAYRYGFGWRYFGTRAGESVQVYCVGVLCGPCEDDIARQWRVDNGKTSQSYVAFLLERNPERGGE